MATAAASDTVNRVAGKIPKRDSLLAVHLSAWRLSLLRCIVIAALFVSCGDSADSTVADSGADGDLSTGGTATGGSAVGGTSAGGAGSGGTATGGMSSTGGVESSGGTPPTGGAGPETGGVPSAGGQIAQTEWLPSWATSIQVTEEGNLPGAPPAGGGCDQTCKSYFSGNTVRQFVWPTVSGEEIRIRLSNEKGSVPVEIQKVHVAIAKTAGDPANSNGQIDVATDVALTFNGAASVTIPAGETAWSDAADFHLEKIRLTAITMQLGAQIPDEITGHPGARTTTYFSSGDAVSEEGPSTTTTVDRWYFIDDIEVMAPVDSYAIAILGDSITDGYGVINEFGRWPDALTSALASDVTIGNTRSVLNFGMGANALTTGSDYQDAGVDRFTRDVLGRDKIKWLIVFEAVNDINAGVEAQPIISAYEGIIQQAKAKGILVYGATITPNGQAGVRAQVNDWIRTSGEFDGILDFDAVLRDPNEPNNLAEMYDNDGLHPNLAGYAALGNSVDQTLFYNVR